MFGPDHLSPASVASRLAAVLRERGALAESEALYRAAVAALEKPAGRTRLASAVVGQGRTVLDAGRPAETRPILDRGLSLSLERFGAADWRTAEARLALGACLVALGDRARGAALVRESRESLRPLRRAHPRLAREADSLAAALGLGAETEGSAND